MIQRFTYTAELAWKTIKDYLESQNIVFKILTPQSYRQRSYRCKVYCTGRRVGGLDRHTQ